MIKVVYAQRAMSYLSESAPIAEIFEEAEKRNGSGFRLARSHAKGSKSCSHAITGVISIDEDSAVSSQSDSPSIIGTREKVRRCDVQFRTAIQPARGLIACKPYFPPRENTAAVSGQPRTGTRVPING